jgi:dipeptidyl aminopeptidase/acylaminoacyl peptidase
VSTRRPITPEDLLRFVFVSSPQLAPDGSSIVFGRAQAGSGKETHASLWRVATDGRSDPAPFTRGPRDSTPRWSPDGERLAFVRNDESGAAQVFVISAAGGEAAPLTSLPPGAIGELRWSPDGAALAIKFRAEDPEWTEAAKKSRQEKKESDPPLAVEHWWYRLDGDGHFGGRRFHLMLIDAETGAHRTAYKADTLGLFTFDFAPDGKRMVIASNRSRRAGLEAWNDDLLILDLARDRLTPVPGLPRGPKAEPAWSPDGALIAYAGRAGEDDLYSTENLELWTCEPTRGRPRCLTGGEDYCLMAVALTDAADVRFRPTIAWTSGGARILAQIGWHGETHVASVARRGGRLVFHTKGPAAHLIGNVTRDGRRVALTVGDATRLPEVAVMQIAARRTAPRRLTDLNGPLLRARRIAKPTSTWVRAADGTRVHVWTLRPPGASTRRGPAVLEIHGGPHAQYGVSFFHEFQVLAAAGYAVFYANPRGSKGYGRDHCAAIRGNWGSADWMDVQAIIAHMKSRPFVDPKRMGIMGGSYGGYMTNWAIGHTSEFAGAITDRCVSNLVSMGGTSDFVEREDGYFPGNFWDRPEARWTSSPIRHFGNVRTPTLIIHSEGDLRCNVEQAEQVFAALNLRGVPSRFVRYPRSTSHGLSRSGPPDLRLHRLREILAWWKKWL